VIVETAKLLILSGTDKGNNTLI
jgi:hypothetical protein